MSLAANPLPKLTTSERDRIKFAIEAQLLRVPQGWTTRLGINTLLGMLDELAGEAYEAFMIGEVIDDKPAPPGGYSSRNSAALPRFAEILMAAPAGNLRWYLSVGHLERGGIAGGGATVVWKWPYPLIYNVPIKFGSNDLHTGGPDAFPERDTVGSQRPASVTEALGRAYAAETDECAREAIVNASRHASDDKQAGRSLTYIYDKLNGRVSAAALEPLKLLRSYMNLTIERSA